ncbi:MAG: glycosyltransferase family 2 protein [Acutalibacteraceae bacterium]
MASGKYKLSVIMPVYNVEKYLSTAIDSVLSQTYKNIEVILVDDGATDSSPAICEEYAKKDSRITVLHKENGGLSDARNYGVPYATGDYIIFFDSDDYFEDEYSLSYVAEKLENENSDVLIFFFKYWYEKDGRIVEYNPNYKNITIDTASRVTQLTDLVKSNAFLSSACTKAIKRTLFIENDLKFIKGITSEDIDWSARLMQCAKSFSLLNHSIYVYRQRSLSISQTFSDKYVYNLKNNIIKSAKMADSCSDDIKECFLNYVAYQYITFLNICCVYKGDTKEYIKEMKEYSYLLNYHWNSKVKMIYNFNKIFGFSIMMKVLKLYLKLR